MPDSIDTRLRSLQQLTKPALSNLWQQLFKKEPPQTLRKDLMRRIIAYRVQEVEVQELSHESRLRLCQVARDLETNPKATALTSPRIKAGTRLARQWKEQVHIVNVEAEGYEYKGDRYESLSEIARLITGTRWSGPAFFGLKRKPAEMREAQ